jgi:hypothetical protein
VDGFTMHLLRSKDGFTGEIWVSARVRCLQRYRK